MSRGYRQFCPIARGLEVVGDRWTLLIIRELLVAPKRFGELEHSVVGISANVLTQRLGHLVADGIVEHDEPSGSVSVYRLTTVGQALRPALGELAKWGTQFLGVPRSGETVRLSWLLSSLQGAFRPEVAAGLRECYELRVDGEIVHIVVADGIIQVQEGPAVDPVFVLTGKISSLLALSAGRFSASEAVARGLVAVEGSTAAVDRATAILGSNFIDVDRGGGFLGAVQSRIVSGPRHAVNEVYEFRIDDEVFHVVVEGGDVRVAPDGAPSEPAATISTDLFTALSIGVVPGAFIEALAEGALRLDGDPAAAHRAMSLFGIAPDAGEEVT